MTKFIERWSHGCYLDRFYTDYSDVDRSNYSSSFRYTNTIFLYNKALRSCMYTCIYIYISAIAGQTAGPNGLNFLLKPLSTPGSPKTKQNFFLLFDF